MATAKPKKIKPLHSALSALKRTGSTLRKLRPTVNSVDTLKARRTARRRSTGLRFAQADCVDFLNAADWDALSAGTVFLSRDYLRVLEAHAPSNLAMRYAMAYDENGPVAAMLMQRVKVTGDRLRKQSTAQRLLDKPIAHLHEHMLVCGNLLVWGARAVAFARGIDASLGWQAVGEAMYRARRADKLHGESDIAMIKDFHGGDQAATDTLRLLGYRSVNTEPDMVLALKPGWKHYDDYLANLTSSYRSAAKRLYTDCDKAGVTLRVVGDEEMAARQHELHGLYEQVHQAQGLRLASLSPGYLPAMARALGPGKFVCRVAEREGRWVGFITSVLDGDTAIGYYVGYDRPANEQAPIYLSLLQSTIEDAIGFGALRLSLGRTALEPKSKMGCKPEPLACAVRHRVSALNWIVSALTRTADPDAPPERNPFKGG